VGFVCFGLAGPSGVRVQSQIYRAQREDVRRRATQFMLTWLRDAIISESSA
jgi:nicotinamide mononucleotide (NMN) deamidase PncC